MQPTNYIKDDKEFALSKDVDVVVWQCYRAFNNLEPARDAFDFVIVTPDLHRDFDAFKKQEIEPGYSYLESNDLLRLYLREHDCSVTTQAKYGAVFHRLHAEDVDNLCAWVKKLQHQRAGDFNKEDKVGHSCTTSHYHCTVQQLFTIWLCSAHVKLLINIYFLIQLPGERVLQPPLNTAISLAPPHTPSGETSPHETSLDDSFSPITTHQANHPPKCPNLAAKQLMLEYTQSKANTLSKPFSTIDLTSAADSISRKKLRTPKTWVKNNLYSLSVAAKERILSPTAWLTDDIISAAQQLIRENNPLVGGLQPPCLGQTCSFTIETGEFIQILHNGADHWLVVSNIGVSRGSVVRVYNSKYQYLTTSTELQLASLVNTPEPRITLEFVDVQKQCGSSDCGVYAVAFATALSLGQDPGTLHFAESEMRRHLFNMLKEKKLKMFPVTKKKRSVRVTEGDPILIYCRCRCQM